jgi:hypothetical protein
MSRRPSPTVHAPGQGSLPLPRLPAIPGSMSCATRVTGLISYALDDIRLRVGLSRVMVAARMSELTGERITEHMLSAMTAESAEGHRFPLQWLPALIEVTDCVDVARSILDVCGLGVLEPEEARDQRLGALRRQIELLRTEERRLSRGRE